MAREELLRVTCDVCGRKMEVDKYCSPWLKELWVKVPEYYTGVGYEYRCRKIDICDDCLEKATRLKFEAGKYTIEE